MHLRSVLTAAALVTLAGTAAAQVSTSPFPDELKLSSLLAGQPTAGTDGFVVLGAGMEDRSGRQVARAGDLNNDGADDFIIGAHSADAPGQPDAGVCYIVFGDGAIGAGGDLDLAAPSMDGWVPILGVASGDDTGWSVAAAGDVNDDGIDDVIIGAQRAGQGQQADAGAAYVIFGKDMLHTGGAIDLASLVPGDGLTIAGIDGGDRCGRSVSGLGDVNGDGVGDIIIGASEAEPMGLDRVGEAYVIFGHAQLGAAVSLDLTGLDGSNGFLIPGLQNGDDFGYAVSGAGDVNGDGLADIIIGATTADPPSRVDAGEVYVVFGRDRDDEDALGAGGTLDVSALDGANGFRIRGAATGDLAGFSVCGPGDLNGDGFDDIAIGAPFAGATEPPYPGETFVVFGTTDAHAGGVLDLGAIVPGDGFVATAQSQARLSGLPVSGAGDVNGDGLADLVIGAHASQVDGLDDTGLGYVLFGLAELGASGAIDLTTLTQDAGFRFEGVGPGDNAGRGASLAGDVNLDGVSDLVIGAPGGDAVGPSDSGESYVVFGRVVASVWNQPNGGAFEIGANWKDGVAPGPDSLAIIDDTLTAAELLSPQINQLSATQIRALKLRTDEVVLNQFGADLTLLTGSSPVLPGLTVGGLDDQTAVLRVINSDSQQAFVVANDVIIGPETTDAQINPESRLHLDGSQQGDAGLDVANRLWIGARSANAELRLTAGADAMIDGELRVGVRSASAGRLLVSNAGSTVLLGENAGDIVLGDAGDADVEIMSGGRLDTGASPVVTTVLAAGGSSIASVRIEGSTSEWVSRQQDLIVAGSGIASLEVLAGATLTTVTSNQLVLGRDAGASADVLVSGVGSSWSESVSQIVVAGEGHATLRLGGGAEVRAPTLSVRPNGTVVGEGSIEAALVTSFGTIAPGDESAPAALQIIGSYRQSGLPPGGGSAAVGALDLGIFGIGPGQQDTLDVTGDLELAGRLSISFPDGFDPDPQTIGQLDLISAASNITGSRFDVVLLPSLGSSDFFSVQYLESGSRTSDRAAVTVSLQVNPLTGDIELDPEATANAPAGVPQGAVVEDLDLDGDPDLVLALPDPTNPTIANGSVVILYNADDGNPANGWEGFGPTLQVFPGVGVDPSSVAIGLVDADAQPDIIVTNKADSTLSVLLVSDPSPTGFAAFSPLPAAIGVAPEDVILDDLDKDGFLDAATANSGDHSITVLWNSGNGIGPLWDFWPQIDPIDLPEDSECPLSIRPGDGDATFRYLATANAGNDSIGLVQLDPTTRIATVLPNLPAGAEPRELIVADLDNDGDDDIATVNFVGNSVSIALNETSGGVLALGATSDLPIDAQTSNPVSITSGDYDDDADTDLAVLADGVVKVLRNDLTAGQLAFTPIPDQAAGADPLLLRSGDLNVDGRDDVVTVSESTGARSGGGSSGGAKAPGDSVSTLVAAPPTPACAGDVNGDGVTDVFDFSDLAANFGSGPGATRAQGDLTGDGFVDVFDFAELAGDFGCGP